MRRMREVVSTDISTVFMEIQVTKHNDKEPYLYYPISN